MKNLYLFSILLAWTLCLPSFLSAQSDGANRIAAIRARLDTLTLRDEAYLGEVDLSVGEAPLSELLRSVAQVGGVNLSVRDGANLTVSCNFTQARIDELLLFLCEQYGLDVQVIGNIVSVFPYEAPVAPPPEPSVRFDRSDSTLSYDLIAVPLREVARRITDSTGVNLIVPQTLYERPVSGYIAAMPFAEALGSLAEINKLEVTPVKGSGAWAFSESPSETGGSPAPASNYVRRRQFAASQLSVDSTGRITAMIDRGNIYDIILDICEQLKLDYFFITPVNAQTSIYLKNTDAKTLFDLLLTGTAYTYYEEGGVYMFGEAKREGLFSTRIVPMRYRTVDKLAEAIPDNLKKGVQTAAFGDLNSMILSGDQRQVARIEQFLRSIDRTVPLITIEVMIVDASKDVLLEAGLGLGLGTEPTQTAGTLSPGLDMTLGAEAVNSLASKIGLVLQGDEQYLHGYAEPRAVDLLRLEKRRGEHDPFDHALCERGRPYHDDDRPVAKRVHRPYRKGGSAGDYHAQFPFDGAREKRGDGAAGRHRPAVAREKLAGAALHRPRAGAQMDLRHAQEQQTGTPAERIHQTDRGRIEMKNNPSSNRPIAGLCPGTPDRNERLGKAY